MVSEEYNNGSTRSMDLPLNKGLCMSSSLYLAMNGAADTQTTNVVNNNRTSFMLTCARSRPPTTFNSKMAAGNDQVVD